MEILWYVIFFAPPLMVVYNLICHFLRKDRLVYEIVCNVIGIPSTLWIYYHAAAAMEMRALMLGFTLHFAVTAYLYMKYSFYGNKNIKNAAKLASLLLAMVSTAVYMTFALCLTADLKKWYYSDPIFAYTIFVIVAGLTALVPFNCFVTVISEIIFQLKGRDIHWKYRNTEDE